MNSNYISTESLYDSGAHLSHARTYSHKYIKREPDGHGGYRYYYKTDRASTTGPAFDSYVREKGGAFASRNANYNDSYATFQPTAGGGSWSRARIRNAKDYRNADKASQIYKEGQKQTEKDHQSRINQASNTSSTPKPEKKSIGDYAKQAINSISTAAGSAYDKGTSFLKNVFSQPIITTEKKWYVNDELVQQETTSGKRKSRK